MVASPSFVPHHALVTAPSASPTRWMLVLHGILGSGGNLRTLARRVAERCPSWGFVLVDLRMHGLSQGAPPPHTIAAAALDLLRLEAQLGLPIAGVMGHSFGGKVALAYLEKRGAPLDEAWVLDASPSAGTRGPPKPTSTRAVLAMLHALPEKFPSRERFLEMVTERGFSPATAAWLGMNVERAGDEGFHLRLDLAAMDALLGDYFAVDLWHVLETPGYADRVHVVIGGRSDNYDAEARTRVGEIAHVETHVLPEAGHWVHVDGLDALVEMVSASLCG